MKKSAMKFGMLACCTVMFLPIAAYFVAGGTLGGVTSNLAILAPLLLCLGAHFVMFKVMGKSCHGASEEAETMAVVERPTEVPAVAAADVRAPSS